MAGKILMISKACYMACRDGAFERLTVDFAMCVELIALRESARTGIAGELWDVEPFMFICSRGVVDRRWNEFLVILFGRKLKRVLE